MKKLFYIACLIFCYACDSESSPDCFQASGDIIQQEFTAAAFERILVNRDVELIISQGPQEIIVETGSNLINDISVEVVGDQLVLTDNNTCNFVRDIGITKVYVTVPNLTEIRCSTQFEISSLGILNFQDLDLLSENFNLDTLPIGDFRLSLNVENLKIVSNNLSFFYLTGSTSNLSVNFPNGNGRFEGSDLIAENVSVFHRGTNDILVNPQQSLTGRLLSTGNLISFNQPPTVNVEETFTGRLIFN